MREIDYSILPEHMREGTRLYIEEGVQPGGFLAKVMANQLVESFAAADEINYGCMQVWARFLYSEAPAGCWGSESRVREWADVGGLRGLRDKIADREGQHEEE